MPDSQATTIAWIALGANLGHRGAALTRLRQELESQDLAIEGASSEILTRPIGVRRQPYFHNQVIRVRSREPLLPEAWLRAVTVAEQAAGRKPTYHWGPRRADADIVLLGERGEVHVDRPDLRVPHPAIADRPYLQLLLAELGVQLPA